MSTYRDRGIVLRIRSVRDTDRYYTIFTENHGKISVLAKGTRRGRSKMSPHLAVFGVVDLMIAHGRLIDRLAGASLSRHFGDILRSFPKTVVVQSFLLTVDGLTKRELAEERIFHLIQAFMEALDDGADPDDAAAGGLVFGAAAIKLLDILGFAPELDACIRCRRPLGSGGAMNVSRGGIECAACKGPHSPPVSAETLQALRTMRRESLPEVPGLRLSLQARRETGWLVELLLSGHFNEHPAALSYLKIIA